MKHIAAHIAATENPAAEDWTALMTAFCDDTLADDVKAGALADLQHTEITGDMLAACANYLLSQALPLDLPRSALDVCGTGGDKSKENVKTFNISTAVAFVVAAGGVDVIKHGNRAVSSQSGSSDVLAALNVPIATTETEAQEVFHKHHLCFVAAPAFHPCLKSMAAARRSFGKPTFFNLLGPLCNPARVTRQVMGVFDKKYLRPVAEAARLLGKTDMMVLHSHDGLDEISIAAPTDICRIQNGDIIAMTVSPEEAGITPALLTALAGGDAAANAAIMREIFANPSGACADIIAINAAAGFMTAGIDDSLKDGLVRARDIMATQKALQKLQQMAGMA
jgi:anthranilate phosphoribosyltransferase